MQQTLLNYQATDNLLAGQSILVTGAANGLGYALAKAAAKLGATVILLDRELRRLETLYDEIENAGGPQPAIYPLDLEGATYKDYCDLANNIDGELKQLNAIVHCAVAISPPTPIEHYAPDDWQKMIQTNLSAPFMLTKVCLPLLKKADNARIIFSTDNKSRAYWGALGVAKAGIESLTKILAHEVEPAEDGSPVKLTVNAIDPGPMRTRSRGLVYPGEARDDLPSVESRVSPYLYLLGPEGLKINGQIFRYTDENSSS